MTDTFRAAYWISADRQGEVLLTGPEHATLSDERLLDVARAEMVNAEITEADGGAIEVGMWEQRAAVEVPTTPEGWMEYHVLAHRNAQESLRRPINREGA